LFVELEKKSFLDQNYWTNKKLETN